MQRAPCSWSSACGSRSTYSLKSSTRTCLGRLLGSTRLILRKPPSSPIRGEHLLPGLLVDLRLLAVGAPGAGFVGALRGHGRVLALPGLADLAPFLVAVADRVRGGLAGTHWARAAAVAALGDDRRLAGLD